MTIKRLSEIVCEFGNAFTKLTVISHFKEDTRIIWQGQAKDLAQCPKAESYQVVEIKVDPEHIKDSDGNDVPDYNKSKIITVI